MNCLNLLPQRNSGVFPEWLYMVSYLFSMVHDNWYLLRGSKENELSISRSIVGNVSVAR